MALSERTVVGVVGDVRVRGVERQSEPQVYLPYQQVADGSLVGYIPKDLAVRTVTSGAGDLLPRIREIIKAADPEQPISQVRTLSEIVAEETASRRTQLWLLGALSAIALLIAGLGVHGLLTFTVAKRSQELGVRRALGAQAGDYGAWLGAERLVRDGDAVKLLGKRAGQTEERELAVGSYDAANEVITLNFPFRGGTYDFRREDEQSDFYPRGKNPQRYAYRPPPARDDGWPTGTLEEAGIDRPALERFIQSILDTPMESVDAPEIHGILPCSIRATSRTTTAIR